jgi:hypothetical protein
VDYDKVFARGSRDVVRFAARALRRMSARRAAPMSLPHMYEAIAARAMRDEDGAMLRWVLIQGAAHVDTTTMYGRQPLVRERALRWALGRGATLPAATVSRHALAFDSPALFLRVWTVGLALDPERALRTWTPPRGERIWRFVFGLCPWARPGYERACRAANINDVQGIRFIAEHGDPEALARVFAWACSRHFGEAPDGIIYATIAAARMPAAAAWAAIAEARAAAAAVLEARLARLEGAEAELLQGLGSR